MPEDGRHDRNM